MQWNTSTNSNSERHRGRILITTIDQTHIVLALPLVFVFVWTVNILHVIVPPYQQAHPVHLSIKPKGRGIGYPSENRLNSPALVWIAL